jgi:CRISPR system Cascade subunit CasD
MPAGLAFTLYAPLAAMGDIAVGERRGGFDRPARSAILGLVAAALGLDRADEAGHAALDRGYRLAQRVRLRGLLMEDYHTVQAPPADRKARWATRREALAAPRLETLLSVREYRADILVDIALIEAASDERAATFPPERVAEALRSPVYALYVGRKSCPFGLPLRPVLASSVERLADLYARLDEPGALLAGIANPLAPLRLDRVWSDALGTWDAPVYADADLAGDSRRGLPDLLSPAYQPIRVERRRDRVASRRRWQFELRDEIVAEPRAVAAAGSPS